MIYMLQHLQLHDMRVVVPKDFKRQRDHRVDVPARRYLQNRMFYFGNRGITAWKYQSTSASLASSSSKPFVRVSWEIGTSNMLSSERYIPVLEPFRGSAARLWYTEKTGVFHVSDRDLCDRIGEADALHLMEIRR
jgi:hypothetical protein